MNSMVEAVRKHAIENYEGAFGWSEIVECWSDDDLMKLIIGDATTEAEAIKRAQDYVDVKEERYREAVGPDVICLNCGTKFPLETLCPKCG